MEQQLYILDIIGSFAFAVYGSYFAMKKDFDIFGIFVAAFLSALGGGTLREMILGNVPFYFFDMNYVLAIVAAIACTIALRRAFHRLKPVAIILDSVGLVTFAFIGASKGAQMELGIFAIVFLATITAVGGGVMRDILLNKVPRIMRYDCYTVVAIMIGLVYGLFPQAMNKLVWANALMLAGLAIRFVVIAYNINLWRPKR